MPFLKLRRLFSRQRLKDTPLDDEGVFGPTEAYSSSESSESFTPTPLGHSPDSLQVLVPEDCDEEGYFDPDDVDYAVFHGPAVDPTEFRIAISPDISYDWNEGQGRLSFTNLDHGQVETFSSYPPIERKGATSAGWEHAPSSPLPTVPHLPDEILQHIFLSYGCISDSRPSPRRGPLLLGQICQRWRTIAHSTPQLWSSLTILAGNDVCIPRMPLLKAWLNRSSLSPLSLSVVYDDIMRDRPGNFGSINLVSEILLTHSARWQTMCFNYTRTRPLIDMLERIPSWGLPILHNVEISLRQGSAHPEQYPILSCFLASSPCLQHLTCRGVYGIPQITFPPQLTHLDIEAALSPKDCLYLLRAGRQLRDCRFHMEHAPPEALDGFPLLVHPLRSLYISSQESLGDFFDHLILPNLETLGISARWTPAKSLPPWPQRQFISLLSRSSPAITAFAVRCLPMTDIELLECLLYMSDTLTNLEVYVVGGEGAIAITDTAITALTFRDFKHNLCPKLEHITLCGCVRATDGLLAGMVASRRRNFSKDEENHQLNHMEVAFPTANHNQDEWLLRALQDEGLTGEVVQGGKFSGFR